MSNLKSFVKETLLFLAYAFLGAVAGCLGFAALTVDSPTGAMLLVLASAFIFSRIPAIAFISARPVKKIKEIYRWAEKNKTGKKFLIFLWIALGFASAGILTYVPLLLDIRKNGNLA